MEMGTGKAELHEKPTALVRRFCGFIKPYWELYSFTLVLNVVGPLLGLAFVMILREMLRQEVLTNVNKIWLFSAIALGTLVVGAVVDQVRLYWGHVAAQKVCVDARRALLSHIQKLSMTFHDNERTGKLLSRIIDDLNLVEELVFHGPEALLTAATLIVVSAVYMCHLNLTLALMGMAVVPLLLAFTFTLGGRMLAAFREVRKRIADVTARAEDSLTGIQVIKSFVREDFEEERFEAVNREHYASRLKVLVPMSIIWPGSRLIVKASQLAVLAYGSYLLGRDRIDVGALVVFVYMLQQFLWPVLSLTIMVERFASFFASLDRFFRYLDIEPEFPDENAGIETTDPEGGVIFEDVHFAYDQQPVLKGVSFHARPGEMVAFVGPSGSGKTTTISLIPGFYAAQSGKILIDGVELSELSLRSLRRHIGIVMQDDHLFATSVRENIAYGDLEASEEEIVAAARAANAHEFIVNLSRGYDTEVGQRGVKLSEGQKQRVSIARALLKNPKILLLDEATSSVDSESERLIQEAFERLRQGRTTFAIAHRLSTVLEADQILFVQDGKIVERGTHEELIRQDGLYKRFYDVQFQTAEKGP